MSKPVFLDTESRVEATQKVLKKRKASDPFANVTKVRPKRVPSSTVDTKRGVEKIRTKPLEEAPISGYAAGDWEPPAPERPSDWKHVTVRPLDLSKVNTAERPKSDPYKNVTRREKPLKKKSSSRK